MTTTLSATHETTTSAPPRSGWIEDWRPEDPEFWATTGRKVAKRNLIFSIIAEHLGFSVWVMWSVLVVVLGTHPNDFPFLNPKVLANADKIFWLVALPNLIGALIRLPYTVAVPKFGGRNWTVISALMLLIPIGMATYAVTHPGTPYWFFLLAAATAGLGGGNFASSMTNIAFFYPEKSKGTALGLNAAGGNLGLSTMQFVVPVLIFYHFAPVSAPLFWLPLVLIGAVCAFRYMNNLHVAKSTFRQQFAAVREPHAWVMSFLYIGTFGSFLGLAAAFPATLSFAFPKDTKFHFLGTALLLPLAFVGPLVGSLARPVGGWVSDKIGGARVTAAVFALMAVVTYFAIQAAEAKSFSGFLTSMLILFTLAGVGNGSTYKMIPAIFKKKARLAGDGDADKTKGLLVKAVRESAATLGMAGAIGALGGFYMPKAIGNSIKATGGISQAFTIFLVMYVVCLLVTAFFYLRPSSKVHGV
jgi:NNP family nitrate/nitrite transporter-like MFS transporter